MAITYKDAGVDIDAGESLVERIKPLARSTMRPEVLGGLGGFAALCRMPDGYREPILCFSGWVTARRQDEILARYLQELAA